MEEQNKKFENVLNDDISSYGMNEYFSKKVDSSPNEFRTEHFHAATDQDEEFRKLIKEKASRHSGNSALVQMIMNKLKA